MAKRRRKAPRRSKLDLASTAHRKLPKPRPYSQWPRDKRQRELITEHLFGLHLMQDARNYAWDHIDPELSPEAQAAAREAAMYAIYGVLMMLEGVAGIEIGPKHWLRYTLTASVEPKSPSAEPLETYELAPGGDGLCMGFHFWREGDFGKATKRAKR